MKLTERGSLRCLMAGLAAIGIGFTPLGLYMLLGPADGNPVGLGLLWCLSLLLGVPLIVAGGVGWLLSHLRGDR
jgi:hypothetical protein